MCIGKTKFGLLIILIVLLVFTPGCNKSEKATVEELKTAFETTVKLYNAGDIDAYFSYIHDDVVYYTPGANSPFEGKPAVRGLYDGLLSQVDKAHWESVKPKFLLEGNTGIVWSPFKHTLKWKDQSVTVVSGRDTGIFTSVKGKWLKIFEHMSRFPKQEKEADLQAIKQIHEKAHAAVKAGDVAAYVKLYTEDGIYLWPNVPAIEGREALTKWFSKRFKKYSAEIEKKIEEIEILGDWAFERGSEVSKIRYRSTDKIVKVRGKFINIFKKQKDGTWKVARRIRNLDHPVSPI